MTLPCRGRKETILLKNRSQAESLCIIILIFIRTPASAGFAIFFGTLDVFLCSPVNIPECFDNVPYAFGGGSDLVLFGPGDEGHMASHDSGPIIPDVVLFAGPSGGESYCAYNI